MFISLSDYRTAMFEDHLIDLFGLEIEDWIDENSIVADFIHWSELMILPDNHPEHSETLKRNLEESEIAVNFSPLHSEANLMITLGSAKIVEKSGDFPKELIVQLIEMATTPLTKHQFLSDAQVGELL